MQKKVGNALYVFDTTPFTITEDTDAEVIYVQQEYLKGYLELNTELESKIKTFNQWLLCVNAPWADDVTPGPDPGPGPEPTPDYHLLTLSDANNIYITGYNSEQLPGESSTDWFSVINRAQRDAGMINSDEGNKIYCNAGANVFIMSEPIYFESMTGLELIHTDWGERYGFVMGDSDMTVNYSYTEKPRYNINFTEDTNAAADIGINPHEQIAGNIVYIRFLNGQSSSTVAVTSNDVELTYDQIHDEYYFTMPEHDVNIKAVYTQPIYNINFTEDSNAQADVQINPQQTVAGHKVNIQFLNGQSSSTITVTSNDVRLIYNPENGKYRFTMPEHDVNIKAVYAQPKNYHLLTLSDANNIYITGYNSEQLPGGDSNDFFNNINNFQIDAGMISADEHNKIYCNAGAKVFITSEPIYFESMTGLELIQTDWGERYGFVMGDSDMTVNYSYTEKPMYNINFTEDTNAAADIQIDPQAQIAGHNVYIRFLNGQSSSTVAVTSNDVELTYDQPNDEYYFAMPEHDVNIKAVYKQPIQISLNLGDTDLTCASYEPSGTYYPHASFVVQVPEGKTTDNYTFVKSDEEHIVVNPVGDNFDVEFMTSGTVTFANA